MVNLVNDTQKVNKSQSEVTAQKTTSSWLGRFVNYATKATLVGKVIEFLSGAQATMQQCTQDTIKIVPGGKFQNMTLTWEAMADKVGNPVTGQMLACCKNLHDTIQDAFEDVVDQCMNSTSCLHHTMEYFGKKVYASLPSETYSFRVYLSSSAGELYTGIDAASRLVESQIEGEWETCISDYENVNYYIFGGSLAAALVVVFGVGGYAIYYLRNRQPERLQVAPPQDTEKVEIPPSEQVNESESDNDIEEDEANIDDNDLLVGE